MCLVHIQPVHAQFFKCHYVVFLMLGSQFFKPRLQLFSGTLHLLDGEAFASFVFYFLDSLHDFPNLFFQQALLPHERNRDFLKLAVSDNHRVIFAGSDSGAEFLAALLLKVLFLCHQDFRGRIQPQKFRRPLLR